MAKARSSSKLKAARAKESALRLRFHKLLSGFTEHVRDELRLHRQLDVRRHPSIRQHIRDTIKIQTRFIRQLKKL